jgi:hypothetical protein
MSFAFLRSSKSKDNDSDADYREPDRQGVNNRSHCFLSIREANLAHVGQAVNPIPDIFLLDKSETLSHF